MEPGTISSAVVYEILQNLRDDVRAQHSRLRTDMNAGFALIAETNKEYQRNLQEFSERLVILETINNERKDISKTRLTILIAGMSTISALILKFLEKINF